MSEPKMRRGRKGEILNPDNIDLEVAQKLAEAWTDVFVIMKARFATQYGNDFCAEHTQAALFNILVFMAGGGEIKNSDSIKSMLSTAAYRSALNAIRDAKVRKSALKERRRLGRAVERRDPERILRFGKLFEAFDRAVGDAETRKIFYSYYRDGKTSREIQEETGLKPASVRVRCMRAKRQLEELMREMGFANYLAPKSEPKPE